MLSRLCYYFLITILIFENVTAKTFTKCELVKELKRQGLLESDMRNWICLIEAESKYRTDAKAGPNKNGSYDWGLFQINDQYWCKPGSRGKDCNINCESLMTDDITESVKCAKIVFKRHGFNGWQGWIRKCRTGNLPNLSDCRN